MIIQYQSNKLAAMAVRQMGYPILTIIRRAISHMLSTIKL